MRVSRGAAFAALAAGTAALFVADLAFGSVRLPFAEAIGALLGSGDEAAGLIMRMFRFPKAVTALLAGAALAVSGLLLQTLFRNPLAGPDSLGVGAGASMGVAAMILATGASGSTLLGSLPVSGYVALVLAASAGAGAVLALILYLSRKFEHGVTLLIVGLMIGYIAGSMVSLLVYFGSPQKVQLYLGWTYGSFAGVRNSELPVLAATLALGLAGSAVSAKALDAMYLGERFASTVGVRVRGSRTRATGCRRMTWCRCAPPWTRWAWPPSRSAATRASRTANSRRRRSRARSRRTRRWWCSTSRPPSWTCRRASRFST